MPSHNQDNTRYEPIKTTFCGQEFASIRVDNIDLYIVSQLPLDPTGLDGFPVPQKYAVQELKRLLGKGISFPKFTTTLNSRALPCLDHDTLSDVVGTYAFEKNCKFAQMLLMASFNTQLRLANDVARGIALEAKMYVEWCDERSAGIQRRREYTDYIQLCAELGMDLCYAYSTIQVYIQTDLIQKYYTWRSATTDAEKRKTPFRSTLDSVELRRVADLEALLARVGTKRTLNPGQAIKWIAEYL